MTRARIPLTVRVEADPMPIDLDSWARRVADLALTLDRLTAAGTSPIPAHPTPDIAPAPARPLRRAA